MGDGGWPSTAAFEQMKLICWNCQGLGSPLTVRALKALVAKEKPDLLFLMETKNREKVITRLQQRLKFRNSHILNPVGMAGGLVLLWYEYFMIDMIQANQELFDMTCVDSRCQLSMRLTCVHAPAAYHPRQLFWTALQQIARTNTSPWLCIGDFNEILVE